jgi:threonine/homoserine/homoserine lactone efflux protein
MATGFFALVFLCAIGVGSLRATYPRLQLGIKWFGAGYLVYLALRILGISVVPTVPGKKGLIGFWEAAAFQFGNPKAWMMGLSASSLFVLHTNRVVASVALAAVLAGTMTCSVCLWVKGGAAMRGWLVRRPERQMRVNFVLAAATVASIFLL